MARAASFKTEQVVAERYQVLGFLGGGELAETYKVRDGTSGRVLALKVLREDAPKGAELRLNREFYHLSRFSHPGIVAAFDYGSAPGQRPYFTMEFCDGQPIDAFFCEGYRSGLESVALQLLSALDRIHSQGLVHCDLKPGNIFVCEEQGKPRAKLLDFGLAGRLSVADAAGPRGTLGYVAPEVLRGVDADARADLYSLGLVLYEVITGQGPGREKDLSRWLNTQYNTELKTPRELGWSIPEAFESLVMALVQREPDRRPRSAAAAIEELARSGTRTELPGSDRLPAPAFVGRSPELAKFREMLGSAGQGSPSAVFVTGERGAGKSRLLSECKFAAQLDGATILSFEPVSLAARRQSLVELVLGHLNVLSAVGVPALGEGRAVSVEEKYRLFEALAQGLKELSCSPRVLHSLVLMVDDLELYDSTSLEFLRYLIFSLKNERLMVLVAGVNEARFLGLVDELGRASGFRHLPLEPMEPQDVGALLAAFVGEVPGTDVLVDWLTRTTGGNPLFIVEAVHSLIEGKVLFKRLNRWAFSPAALSALSVPQSVADVLRSRVGNLSSAERRVLGIGAIATSPVTLGFLSVVLEQDERQLDGPVARLRALGFLRSLVVDGEASFGLSSKMLEAAVVERMSTAERHDSHRRVAQALEQLRSVRTDGLVYDLAHHYAEAGIEESAYRYSLEAGARARANRLSEQALGYYETALALSARARSAMERVDLLERIGELREATAKYPEAIGAYTQALSTAAADGELASDCQLRARLTRRLGLAQQKRGDHVEALDSLNQALLESPDRGTAAYIDTLNDMGWSYVALGRLARAEALLSAALRLSEGVKSSTPVLYNRIAARSFYHLGVLAWSRSDFVLAQQLVEQSLEHYEAIGDDHSAGEACHFLATLWWRRGDTAKARDFYQRQLPARRAAGDVYFVINSLQGLGVIDQEEGEWNQAHDHIAAALDLAERTGDVQVMADLNSNLGMTCDERGEWDQALALFRRAVDLYARTRSDSYGRKVVMANLAQLLARRGELAEAERALEEARELAGPAPAPEFTAMFSDCRIQLLLLAGHLDPARDAIAQSFGQLRHERDPRKLARLYTLASELRIAAGDFARAVADARRALVLLGDRASSREYAVALRFSGLAKCLLDQSDSGGQEIYRSIELLRNTVSRYELALSLVASAQALTKQGRAEMVVDLKLPLTFRPVAQQEVTQALSNLKEARAILRSLDARPAVQRADELMETVTHLSATTKLKARGREEYLKVFYTISELIGMGLEEDDFFERILDSIVDVIKAERGLLFLVQGGKLVPAAARNVDHSAIEDATDVSRSVLRKVKRQGEMVFSADALTDPRFNSANSVMLNKIRSLLCVPLTVENRVVGTIYVDSRVTAHLFLEEDKNLLLSVANLLAATIDKSAVFRKLQEEMSALREDMLVDAATGYFMGRSKAMKDVYRVIDRIAPSNCTVLLTGETGTGKGVLARLIHAKSERRATRFVSINCGALPENLFESELFGHARGAFTGAIRDKEGLFEDAVGGTVFLDEISNTTLGVQAKLLQVLDEKVIRRVGETEPRLVDVRLVCATNRDLQHEVQAGRFREDLFYRMNGVTVNVPALRERAGDVALLADYFVRRYATQLDKSVDGCEEEVLEVFARYPWPGNVRELQNVIERSVIMAQKHMITIADLGTQFAEVVRTAEPSPGGRQRVERKEVVEALRSTSGNVSKAAELLGVHRRQFQRLMLRYKITRANPR